MYTPEERSHIRAALLQRAAADSRLSGGAVTGSGADNNEDRYSDVDLAFGVSEDADAETVLADWTAHMYECHKAAHHHDVKFGSWTYRVFLLPSTMQIDLAFAPAAEFRPLASTFRLVFGKANEPREFPEPSPQGLIGLAWLYALHARGAIARGKFWQAEYMIGGVRNQILALACLRHQLPVTHARGTDRLPDAVTAPLRDSLVKELNRTQLSLAFRVTTARLLVEIELVNSDLAGRLQEPLASLQRYQSDRS